MIADEKPPITSSLRVGELLEAYPELEQVLVDLAPPFRKLRHRSCGAPWRRSRPCAVQRKWLAWSCRR